MYMRMYMHMYMYMLYMHMYMCMQDVGRSSSSRSAPPRCGQDRGQ
jgi:hypothetical protein